MDSLLRLGVGAVISAGIPVAFVVPDSKKRLELSTTVAVAVVDADAANERSAAAAPGAGLLLSVFVKLPNSFSCAAAGMLTDGMDKGDSSCAAGVGSAERPVKVPKSSFAGNAPAISDGG